MSHRSESPSENNRFRTFHNLFPNITVEGRTAPPDVDNEQLLAFIKAGTNSHVHQTVNNEDTWYIRHNLLQPLDELPGFQEVWDRLDPRDNYTWSDGHVYSLSWYTDPMAMYLQQSACGRSGTRSRTSSHNLHRVPELGGCADRTNCEPTSGSSASRLGRSGGITSSSTTPITSRPRATIR